MNFQETREKLNEFRERLTAGHAGPYSEVHQAGVDLVEEVMGAVESQESRLKDLEDRVSKLDTPVK